jgi:hypothetical protein
MKMMNAYPSIHDAFVFAVKKTIGGMYCGTHPPFQTFENISNLRYNARNAFNYLVSLYSPGMVTDEQLKQILDRYTKNWRKSLKLNMPRLHIFIDRLTTYKENLGFVGTFHIYNQLFQSKTRHNQNDVTSHTHINTVIKSCRLATFTNKTDVISKINHLCCEKM